MSHNCTITDSLKVWRKAIQALNSDSDDWNDLLWGVFFNFSRNVEDELKKGANVNQIFKNGNTPLHIAVCNQSNISIIKIILKYRPLLNIRNSELETPLNILIKNQYFDADLLKTLLEMGADPNIPDKQGNTPFHYLFRYSSIDQDHFRTYVALFVDNKAKLNVQNNHGDTPLHLAVRVGFKAFVEMLLEKGACICIKNGSKDTVIHIAFKNRTMFSGIYDMIVKEAIILGYLRILVDKKYHEKMNKMKDLKILEERCNEQLSEFKSVKIADSNLSIYDVLTSTPDKVAKYLRNKNILISLKNSHKLNCGIFQRRLVLRFQKGMERLEAMESGYRYLGRRQCLKIRVC
ncbi:hypothetical protein WA026_000574 [Henosepilachna vigintioctopunctata]|uniref:Uncharacterized protein n=1 Tax=Henosepilachna vigintioctopunctata TaxID=420089 RepID=A0AAW1V4K9_9CUCU